MATQIDADSLPGIIPIFPLSGVILLPRCNLPLNIFEPRYLRMIRDAATSHKMIGMVQPQQNDDDDPVPHAIGGAGRIEELVETEDGRLEIVLRGVSRFRIDEELHTTTPYRLVKTDWSDFAYDLIIPDHSEHIGRQRLLAALGQYLKQRGLSADYEGIDGAPDEILVSTLSMIIPFETIEKQALLEAQDTAERCEILKSLLGMATAALGLDADNDLH